MVQIPLEGRSPVDACLEILKGKYASLVEGKYEDDRELQMAACFFLGKSDYRKDTGIESSVVLGLLQKLNDERAKREYNLDNEGYWGTDYFVSACAAEALVQIGYRECIHDVYEAAEKQLQLGHPKMKVLRNNREGFWHPRELFIGGDCLRLRE